MGESGSVVMGTSGRAIMMAITSAINVVRTLCERQMGPDCSNIASRMRRAMPIILSHEPPICDEGGVLKVHVQPSELG